MSQKTIIIEKIAKSVLGAHSATFYENIQDLWSGYGAVERYHLEGGATESVVVKHVKVPTIRSHPRGWNSDLAHQRKMHSYEVELSWYKHWACQTTPHCAVPKAYFVDRCEHEYLFLLEDLDAAGYQHRVKKASVSQLFVCLKWLARFHAVFMGRRPGETRQAKLWKVGSYWHLATRQSELDALDDDVLREAADKIDALLNGCRYQTIIHGDSKIANFCFSSDCLKVVAVDFQYVGGGCGIKDVMLLLSSTLDSEQCEKYEAALLDFYFGELKMALSCQQSPIDLADVEQEWRGLYPVAWADFVRFLKGWSPGHWKINQYSERMTKMVTDQIQVKKEY